jgi:hypothetical protein
VGTNAEVPSSITPVITGDVSGVTTVGTDNCIVKYTVAASATIRIEAKSVYASPPTTAILNQDQTNGWTRLGYLRSA